MANRTLWLTPAAIAAAIAAGAGADRLAVVTYDTSAKATEVRLLGDGQIGVTLETRIGDCTSSRELVFNADGTRPRLNGRDVDDGDSRAIGQAVAAFAGQARALEAAAGGKVTGARLLADGQLAVEMERETDMGKAGAEIIYAADGGAPRVHGEVIADSEAAAVGAVLAATAQTAGARTKSLTRALTAPLADVPAR
jgi:hypothetical protein